MKIRPLEFSIVVVASDCNPTILNPDFLERQDIVPSGWGWKISGPAITTPPFASVTYNNGVSVSVEPNKFQTIDKLMDTTPDTSLISEIARKYIEVLPHVRYTAVGLNFKSFAAREDAESFLKQRFLKAGIWDGNNHSLVGVGLKFVYPHDGGRLNLSLDGATIVDRFDGDSEESSGVLVQANYHRDCENYPSDKQVIEHLSHIKDDWNHFQAMASEILG